MLEVRFNMYKEENINMVFFLFEIGDDYFLECFLEL